MCETELQFDVLCGYYHQRAAPTARYWSVYINVVMSFCTPHRLIDLQFDPESRVPHRLIDLQFDPENPVFCVAVITSGHRGWSVYISQGQCPDIKCKMV